MKAKGPEMETMIRTKNQSNPGFACVMSICRVMFLCCRRVAMLTDTSYNTDTSPSHRFMFGGEGSDYYKQLMDGVTVDEGHIMHILTQRDGVLFRPTALYSTYSCGSTPVQSLRRPVRYEAHLCRAAAAARRVRDYPACDGMREDLRRMGVHVDDRERTWAPMPPRGGQQNRPVPDVHLSLALPCSIESDVTFALQARVVVWAWA